MSKRIGFAIRTIRKGQVKVDGIIYKPRENHLLYDGRLDGLRYAFGRYSPEYRTLCLWGTEKSFRSPAKYEHGPEVVEGKFPWYWWFAVEEPSMIEEGRL